MTAFSWRFPILFLLLALANSCSALRRPPVEVDRSQDARILREVESRIAAEPSLDSRVIRVDVDGAIVLLYGTVNGIGAWQCAIRTAELVSGVQTVVDYLVIERGPRSARCLAPRGEDTSMARNMPRPA